MISVEASPSVAADLLSLVESSQILSTVDESLNEIDDGISRKKLLKSFPEITTTVLDDAIDGGSINVYEDGKGRDTFSRAEAQALASGLQGGL